MKKNAKIVAWRKMPRFNVFSRNVNTIHFPLKMEYISLRKSSTSIQIKIWPQRVHRNMKLSIIEVKNESHVWYLYIQKVRWNRWLKDLCTLILEFQKNFMKTLHLFLFVSYFSDKKGKASKTPIFSYP